MKLEMNPITISQALKDTYIRYLYTTHPLCKMDTHLYEEYIELLKKAGNKRLFIGPYLEAAPPYKKGLSLDGFSKIKTNQEWKLLYDKGICTVHPDDNDKRFPWARELYWHQQKALEISDSGDNFVVATGTGSGKTECYLLPIFKYILQNPGKGVRALLIFPMNALVNDQMERLRRYLYDCPAITFGHFTGDTPNSQSEAARRYKDDQLLENEIISREQIRKDPPDILITNYSMLEYLLLRPGDAGIFEKKDDAAWQYLILDEVHTYTGAQGIEVAYLLRRLKDRVGKNNNSNRIRIIATSATLMDQADANDKIAEFTTKLFGETIEANNIIRAQTDAELDKVCDASLEKIDNPVEFYCNLPTLEKIKSDYKMNQTVSSFSPLRNSSGSNPEYTQSVRQYLYNLLKQNKDLISLWQLIQSKSKKVESLAVELWPDYNDIEDKLQGIVKLVELGNFARQNQDDPPLFPARYHFMVSGLNGVFADLRKWSDKRPWSSFALSTADLIENDNENVHPFELAVCRICGHPYVTGFITKENEKSKLVPQRDSFFEQLEVQGDEFCVYLTFNKHSDVQPEFLICTSCGIIGESCDCGHRIQRSLYLVWSQGSPVDNLENRCLNCGEGETFTSHIATLRSSQHAPAAVLAEALYRQLPSLENLELDKIYELSEFKHRFDSREASPIVGQGRKMLMFSDSRQHAAFFGPFLQRTHTDQLSRRLVYETISKSTGKAVCLDEFVDDLQKMLRTLWETGDIIVPLLKDLRPNYQFKNEYYTRPFEQKTQAAKFLYNEFFKDNRIEGLEGFGIIQVSVDLGRRFPGISLNNQQLSSEESASLAQIILEIMRLNGAISCYGNVNPEDFSQSSIPTYYYIDQKPNLKQIETRPIISERKNHSTSIQIFIRKWLEKIGKDSLETDNVIRKIIEILLSPQVEVLIKHPRVNAWQINHNYIQFQLWRADIKDMQAISGMKESVYYCNNCGLWTFLNTNGLCLRKNCTGTVLPFDNPEDVWQRNHYAYIARNREPIEIRAVEHTAQLTRDTAREYQHAFSCGQLSALSCSTTFELGVDLGDLNVVFLRNVPPSVSNYVQRAGRAGRRSDLVAFVLTFARSLPHDQYYFRNPDELIAGKIKPPVIKLENEKIVKRHANAIAISKYWREFSKAYSIFDSNNNPRGPRVYQFFDDNPDLSNNYNINEIGCFHYAKWIKDNYKAILDHILQIVSNNNQIGGNLNQIHALDDWFEFSVDNPDYGILGNIYKYVKNTNTYYKGEIERAHDEAEKARKNGNDKQRKAKQQEEEYWEKLSRQLMTYQTLINFLSKRGYLPSYAFPVDVVQLHILSENKKRNGEFEYGVDLNRDLKTGLGEYAPGCELIANARRYKSGAVYKLPVQEFELKYYRICSKCEHLTQSNDERKLESLSICEGCGSNYSEKLESSRIYKYIIPKWGFASPREEKPKRIYVRSHTRQKINKSYPTQLYADMADLDGSKIEFLQIDKNEQPLFSFRSASGMRLFMANQGPLKNGFRICRNCGRLISNQRGIEHKTPFGRDCHDPKIQNSLHLAHLFDSDIFEFRIIWNLVKYKYDTFNKYFWWSLLYALVEGASRVLDVQRDDLDCVLYPTKHYGEYIRSCLLIDSVPGGAGHVHRLTQKENGKYSLLIDTIKEAKRIVTECDNCLIDESCYNCLHHFSNQYRQHYLRRREVAGYLEELVALL